MNIKIPKERISVPVEILSEEDKALVAAIGTDSPHLHAFYADTYFKYLGPTGLAQHVVTTLSLVVAFYLATSEIIPWWVLPLWALSCYQASVATHRAKVYKWYASVLISVNCVLHNALKLKNLSSDDTAIWVATLAQIDLDALHEATVTVYDLPGSTIRTPQEKQEKLLALYVENYRRLYDERIGE